MDLRKNLQASVSVFLVALPLCLGLAVASGAQPVAGIIAGIIGGLVVGWLSDSPVSVAGPAAGLTVVVLQSIETMGGYPAFLAALIYAGLFQLAFAALRGGVIGNFFPSSVIQGLLTSIGLLLILKQLPHAVGYDVSYEGNLHFHTPSGENTFDEILHGFQHIHPHAIAIFAVSMLFLVMYDHFSKKRPRLTSVLPGPLAVVILGILVHLAFNRMDPSNALGADHLVQLPNFRELFSEITFPDFSALFNPTAVTVGLTIALVATLETLLNIDAADKLDPRKRTTTRNRELIAQGVGNVLNGLLGGLPVTSVIIRTSVNVSSGATQKWSTVFHGAWLLLSIFLAFVLNLIPLSALAAILIMVGYKLCKPSVFMGMFKKGWNQSIPFLVTIAAILVTDLLTGTMIGMVAGMFFVIRSNFHEALLIVNDGNRYLLRMQKDITFLNKARLREILLGIPDQAYLLVDGSKTVYVDVDIMETLRDFADQAGHRGITVEFKKSRSARSPMFQLGGES